VCKTKETKNELLTLNGCVSLCYAGQYILRGHVTYFGRYIKEGLALVFHSFVFGNVEDTPPAFTRVVTNTGDKLQGGSSLNVTLPKFVSKTTKVSGNY